MDDCNIKMLQDSCPRCLSYGSSYLKYIVLSAVYFLICNLAISQDETRSLLTLSKAVEIAMQNNPLVENAHLRIDQSISKKMASWSFEPTEFNYKYGQLYSEGNDRYFEVIQDFGPILNHYQNYKKAKTEIEISSTEYEIIVLELTSKVKAAYTWWQYRYYIANLLAEEKEYYEDYSDRTWFRYETGDISLLEKTKALANVSKINLEYLVATDELIIAENNLKQFLISDENYIPALPEPQMYLVDKTSDTTAYEGNILLQEYEQEVTLARANESVAKSKYFPGIQAGYFTQDIGTSNNLYGWQVGISVPLWIPKQQAQIRQAQIESIIALNSYEYQKTIIKNEIENLLFELNKYFRQIRHYIEYALPESDLLIKNAASQFESEEITYDEYLESISLAYQIKQDYYLILNNYNQVAIQLETYGH